MTTKPIPLIVHATHEAGLKLGGIGAVLDGLLSSQAYNAAVGRSILVGPVNTWNPLEMERLFAPDNRMRTIYSLLPGREQNQAPVAVARALQEIEARMNVRFLYGARGFGRYEHEIILVDAGAIAGNVIPASRNRRGSQSGNPALNSGGIVTVVSKPSSSTELALVAPSPR